MGSTVNYAGSFRSFKKYYKITRAKKIINIKKPNKTQK